MGKESLVEAQTRPTVVDRFKRIAKSLSRDIEDPSKYYISLFLDRGVTAYLCYYPASDLPEQLKLVLQYRKRVDCKINQISERKEVRYLNITESGISIGKIEYKKLSELESGRCFQSSVYIPPIKDARRSADRLLVFMEKLIDLNSKEKR